MASPAPAAGAARGPGRDEAKQGRRRGAGDGEPQHRQCAARLLSLTVEAAVMAAAVAIFLLFAAASALLLLVLVLAARAFRHHRGSRYRVPSLDPSSPSLRRAGLSPADIRRLPSFAFPSTSSASCAVCLEAACAGERWRAMPTCTHALHADCVDSWLARTPACPVCRAAVTVAVPMSYG